MKNRVSVFLAIIFCMHNSSVMVCAEGGSIEYPVKILGALGAGYSVLGGISIYIERAASNKAKKLYNKAEATITQSALYKNKTMNPDDELVWIQELVKNEEQWPLYLQQLGQYNHALYDKQQAKEIIYANEGFTLGVYFLSFAASCFAGGYWVNMKMHETDKK